jgi:hypothetical protein
MPLFLSSETATVCQATLSKFQRTDRWINRPDYILLSKMIQPCVFVKRTIREQLNRFDLHKCTVIIAYLLNVEIVFAVDVRFHRTVASGYGDDACDVLQTRLVVDFHLQHEDAKRSIV